MISGIFYAVVTWYFELLDSAYESTRAKVIERRARKAEDSSAKGQ